ncbi:GntR family transcriptional regulator [Alcaligenes endophyticus]|uniref:GntR family transcriptional regulator n=1 Tax=Alcaligenes endophyticus TaxID=1929088 RepID=A0ABT8EFB3_9BURK|nr:GntR family transcriptional regulator [Alcaligenes endophyticus]MCX5590392.1 GntR family transcriptional regulator [Alcaligenes endophyticus]MDN4119944.1 GntR family transcriptional regulator [Alcaligenes endophyticus]
MTKNTVKVREGLSATKLSMEDVVEILRERIVNHELPPGSKLSEAVLTEEFNVSRPRIREAFGVLEDRGLIERIPNRGAVVTRLNVEEVYALFEVREVLEALAVRLATEKATSDSWTDLIERMGEPAVKALAEDNLDYYISCVNLFREKTLTAADNPILAAQMEGFYDRTKVLIRRLMLVPGRAKQGLKEHQELLRAMAAGDAEKAEQLKRANIRGSFETFRQYQKYLM